MFLIYFFFELFYDNRFIYIKKHSLDSYFTDFIKRIFKRPDYLARNLHYIIDIKDQSIKETSKNYGGA